MLEHLVNDLASLEALFGDVAPASIAKETDRLHPVYVRWLAQARFALLATSGPHGLDVSPRGDAGPLVRIVDEAPWVSAIAGRHHVEIGGFTLSADGRRLVVVATEDNLLKGAATQALQNLNLAFGLPEFAGILDA